MDYTRISFTEDITQMMFAFGDNPKPNPETVCLIESILLKQLRTIVQEALKYSDGKSLKGTEMVFLLRHNKMKMRRFVKYLHNKYLRAKIQNFKSDVVDLVDGISKPKSELLDYIEYIDETGEFTDLSEVDDVKLERQLRADRISQIMDEKTYMEFCRARQVSFKNTEKLRVWVDPRKEIAFSSAALTVLSYFAYQTIAEIVDYVILLRIDGKKAEDPISQLASSYYTSIASNGLQSFEGINAEYSKTYSIQPPISVSEIKEIMRRVYTPQTGFLNFGGKIPETHYLFAL